MRRIMMCLVGLVFLTYPVLGDVTNDTAKTWTDNKGRQLKASFVKKDGVYVVFRDENGKEVRIKFDTLSEADQKAVEELAGKQGGETEPASKKQPVAQPPWPAGKISGPVKTAKDPNVSYLVYLPSTFTMDREWPVMFLMGPLGGNEDELKTYVKGADINGWVLAMSVQYREDLDVKKGKDAITAMVKDVRERLPVDKRAIYAGGFAGGATMAYWLAGGLRQVGFAGILACGAGTTGKPPEMSPKTLIYGLCGSNSILRWDMAATFQQFRKDLSKLRFFEGGHTWAKEELLSEGMLWLHCRHLEQGRPTEEMQKERERIAGIVLDQIGKDVDAKPERAYEWALYLTKFPSTPKLQQKAVGYLQPLMKRPEIQEYVKALKDLDKFVEKYFAANPNGGANNTVSREAKHDADKLAKKYENTSLVGLFSVIGDKAK